jgi:hypothetical protein
MSDTGLGEKERLQVLLAEYSSLRSEINARMTSVYTVASFSAAVVIWLLQQDAGHRLYLGLAAAVVGLSICAWTLTRDLVRTALRVKQIELEVNRRVGERLMVWETEWGGQTSSLWGDRLLHTILHLNRPPYSDKISN